MALSNVIALLDTIALLNAIALLDTMALSNAIALSDTIALSNTIALLNAMASVECLGWPCCVARGAVAAMSSGWLCRMPCNGSVVCLCRMPR